MNDLQQEIYDLIRDSWGTGESLWETAGKIVLLVTVLAMLEEEEDERDIPARP